MIMSASTALVTSRRSYCRLRNFTYSLNDAITLGKVSGEVLGSRVTVDGHLDGPDSVPTLDVAAKDLILGPRLRKALGPLGERAAPFFEQLQPTDTTRADVEVKVRPPDGSDPELLLDLTRLSYMDSVGIGELVSSYRTVKRLGGALKILKPTKKVRDSLSLTQLLPIMEVFDDEETAVASFTSADDQNS